MRARLDGQQPGVRVLTVDHDGNSTDSPEEADAIVAEIEQLLGAAWTDERGHPHRWRRTTSWSSPRTTRRWCCCASGSTPRGWTSVRAGTVDKFQGQQAPVVFVSMTASSIDDVPRGIAFLLNRNRLNVAVSRAKYLSVIVRSPLLTEYLPSTPDRLIELGAFLSLPSCGTPTG